MKLAMPPVVQVAFAAGAMWSVANIAPAFVIHFPGQITIATAFILTAVCIAGFAIAMFYKAKTTVNPTAPDKASSLVATGLYKISRNPMYLAMALLLAGWAIHLGSWVNILVLGGFIHAMTVLQIKPEEAALHDKFGEAYADYCRRTRRWI